MAEWRLARSLIKLKAEVDQTWPNRSRVSDGTIGDPAHAGRVSDHNPNPLGVVRAFDATAAGMDRDRYAEHIRRLGAEGFPALQNGGYVISNGRIASAVANWAWRTYDGANKHDKHTHVSVGKDPAAYEYSGSWRIADITKEIPVGYTLDQLHADIMTSIAEDRADDGIRALIYKYTYELWTNLISGAVGTGPQENGTPAYATRLDMVQDVLNVPSMVRTIESMVGEGFEEVYEAMGVENGQFSLARRLDNIDARLTTLTELLERAELNQ